MTLPKEFFTPESMLTLAGASGATFVICNSLQRAFNFNPRWLALAVAQLIVLAGTASSGATAVADYLVGVINGFLVYLTAAGGTNAAGGGGGPSVARGDKGVGASGTSGPGSSSKGFLARGAAEDGPHPSPGRQRRFLTPWF